MPIYRNSQNNEASRLASQPATSLVPFDDNEYIIFGIGNEYANKVSKNKERHYLQDLLSCPLLPLLGVCGSSKERLYLGQIRTRITTKQTYIDIITHFGQTDLIYIPKPVNGDGSRLCILGRTDGTYENTVPELEEPLGILTCLGREVVPSEHSELAYLYNPGTQLYYYCEALHGVELIVDNNEEMLYNIHI